MPKQRRYNFQRLSGTSSSEQSAASRARTDNNAVIGSVNEKLAELRLAQPAEAAQKKRDIAEKAASSSLPPNVNHILGVPEVAPPQARTDTRIRYRRTPGPAPPSSWLRGHRVGVNITSGHNQKASKADQDGRRRPGTLLRFQQLTDHDPESHGGLSHSCLKLIAINWSTIDEDDYDALESMPLQVRLRMLSYLAFYGPVISIQALIALTRDEQAVTLLDLGGLLGHNTLTLPKLSSLLKSGERRERPGTSEELLESWEDDGEPRPTPRSSLSSPFADLTHLCLSHPSQSVLWRDLLSLSKHLPMLTHLSLAYWPRPTLTPNLSTTTIASPDGQVHAGGSHFYSNHDDDMAEPAALLRQLSASLLNVEWLDVEGCASWFGAFAWPRSRAAAEPDAQTFEESRNMCLLTNWRNVRYIRCAQGYVPEAAQTMLFAHDIRSEGPSAFQKLSELTQRARRAAQDDDIARRAYPWLEAELWLYRHNVAIAVRRKEANCPRIKFDFGW